MRQSDIIHKDFKPTPYWWEAYKPVAGDLADVPRSVRVVIVGAGYAGLSCAIELADAGIDACVLEAAELGAGASTRSGGGVTGGVNIGKSFTGKVLSRDPGVMNIILASGYDAFSLIEALIEREGIRCFWEKKGRFVGAWTPRDYKFQESRVASLNADADAGSYMVPRERQREEMASDYYFGGMVVERSAKLHPALYYKGLLDAARRRKITICSMAAVKTIARSGKGWRITTSRGEIEAGDQVGIPDEFGAILQAVVQEPVRIDELRPQAQLPQRDQALLEQVVDQTRLVTDIPLHDLEGGSQSRGNRGLIECRRSDREHGRERGPQLVAQLGEECVLGPIGLLGRDPGRPLRLRPRLGGDVADDDQPARFAAVREARDADIVGGPGIPRVRIEAIRQLRGSFQLREVLGDPQPSRDHVAVEADEVLIEAPDESKGSPVHARDPPPGVEHDDRVEHLLHDQGIADRSDLDQVEPPQQHQAEHARHHEGGGRQVIFSVG